MFDQKLIPEGAIKIVKALNSKGFKCYLVGGCIRDLLLGKTPFEWDLTTDALPEEVAKLFEKVVPTGIEFGTVTVVLNDGNYEVTTFRKDQKYVDGRHPTNVVFTKDLLEDLSRRDFTINAMAFDPLSNDLVDEFEGQKDLEKKLIRAVGDPKERFSEDGLRSIRACRFAAQLNFEIEKKTDAAINPTLDVTRKVAIERIQDEVKKMLGKADKPSVGFEHMQKTGLLELFMPELIATLGIEQPKAFHKYDVFYHSIYACDHGPKDNLAVRLAALLHDICKPECKDGDHFYGHDQKGAETVERLLKRFKFSNQIIKKVINLVKNHMFNYESKWTDAAVRRFMRRVGVENTKDLFLLRFADTKAMEREIDSAYLMELQGRMDKILDEENALHVSDLKIKGSDVMNELKIPPGPKVGKVLNELLEKVLDDPALNQKETLLELVKTYEKL
ncbi:MAG: HD domain-containing protein [Candidatus Saganbacteria bacterium]|nr:HD domain-containing protein [Candidatus Saganbacteria bacterium]